MRSTWRRPLVLLVVCAATLVGTVPASAAGPTAAPTTAGSGYFHPWALQSETYMANQVAVPRDQALADARNNDLITAHPIGYRDSLAAMRQANPRLKIYVYLNAMYSQRQRPDQSPLGAATSSDGRPSCLTTGTRADCYWPDSWYSRDVHGDYVRAQASGNYLMNPRVQGWRDSRVQSCKDKLKDSGYDGCYVDMLGPASVSASFVTSPPVDPSTGKQWDVASYVATTSGVGGYITESMAPTSVIANGLADGTKYFSTTSPTKDLLARVDGGVAEAWLRKGITPADVFPTETAWKASVNMLVDAEHANPATGKVAKPVLVIYKVWTPATQAQKSAHRLFAMSSFLLGTGGRSLFFYSDDPKVSRTATNPWYRFDIGTPTAAYGKAGGVYRRPFTHGLVLVNPTPATVTVPLGGAYTTITGQHVTTVTLAPHTGQILKH